MGNCWTNVFQINDENIPVPDGSSNEYFDWQNENEPIFWPIEEQTGDLCWVHVVVDTLEGLYAITHNRRRIKLSKQELVDKVYGSCKPIYDPRTNTYSTSMEDVYNWIIDNGLSLEQDYGSGKFEATLQDPKERTPGCRIFNLIAVRRFYSHDNEDRILEELNNSPGAAVMIMDTDRMDCLVTSQDTEAVYSIGCNADEELRHGVVVSGYDDTGSRNSYWVRDSLESTTPNSGHYRVTRRSSVQDGEKDPVVYVLFPYGVSLS